jgi:hypothetical protein
VVTLAEDETFHPSVCLVAIEPLSNFILVEEYQPQRDSLTWTTVVGAALEGLNVLVIQVASDAAQGLIAHARKDLLAHHSPDLFHVSQNVGAAFFPTLHAQARKAQNAAQRQTQQAAQWRAAQAHDHQQRAQGQAGPGRPRDFARRIAEHQDLACRGRKEQGRWERRSEQVRACLKKLSDAYHPFDLRTGAARKAPAVRRALKGRFDRLASWAAQWKLGAAAQARLAKARRQLPNLNRTIAWYWKLVEVWLTLLGLTRAERRAAEPLIAACYLERVAKQADSAQERQRRLALAASLRQRAWARDGPLAGKDRAWRERLERRARECAGFFQRSSSCVEGRNGQLALRHHSFRGLSVRKLSVLTVLHNYYLRREDGTTAAERFFAAAPRPLFAWLLEEMPEPSRGAARRCAGARQAA